jgi:hypothetical protein
MILNISPLFKKGEMIVDIGGWVGVVMQNTRGKNPTILPMMEMFGFEHECGSKYVKEVVGRITEKEFRDQIQKLGFDRDTELYFTGKLVEPIREGETV